MGVSVNSNPKGVLIELVGPAGVGKTTLTHILQKDGVRSGLHLPRSVYVSALLEGSLRLVPAVASRLGYSRWLNRAELRSVAYLHGWHRIINVETGMTLLDQGPVYRLAFLKEFGPALTKSRSFTAWWSATLERWSQALDVIIRLDAPDETLLKRINQRTQAHLIKGSDEQAARLFLTRYRSAFDEVIETMKAVGNLEVINLDTDRLQPKQAATAVLARLAARDDHVS